MSLLGRLPEPVHRLTVVLRNALPVVVHEPQGELGVGVSLQSQRSEFAQRARVVASIVCLHPRVEIRDHRRRRGQEQQGGDDSANGRFHRSSHSGEASTNVHTGPELGVAEFHPITHREAAGVRGVGPLPAGVAAVPSHRPTLRAGGYIRPLASSFEPLREVIPASL